MAEKTVAVRLTARIDAYKRAMADAQRSSTQFAAASQSATAKLGTQFQNVGRRMTMGITLPLVAVGGLATKMAMDFDQSMTRIQTLVGLSAGEVDGMRDSVLGLAGETARSPEELADALFVVTSAGLRGEDAMSALEMAAKASAIGMGDTGDIARAVAGAMNAYGSDVLDASEATDILTATARAGNFETSELAGALGRVLPFANQAKVGLEDVGGAVALMTRSGLSASESITQLNGLMKGLVVPSKESVTALADVGLTAQQLREYIGENGLVAGINMLDEAAGGNTETLRRMIGTAEGTAAAIAILDADTQTLADTFGVTNDAAGITQSGFDDLAESSAFKLQKAFNDVKTAMTEIGLVILPIAASIAGGVSEVVSAFTDLPDPIQGVVLALGAVLIAAGPVLTVVGKILTSTTALKVAMVGLRTAMMAHPIMALATVAAGVAAAVTIMGNRSADAAKEVDDMARSMAEASDAAEGLLGYLDNLVAETEPIRDALDAAGTTTKEFADAALAGGEAWDEMRQRVSDAIAGIDADDLTKGTLQKWLQGSPELIAKAVAEFEQLERVSGNVEDASEDVGAALDLEAEALGDVTAAAEVLGPGLDELAEAQKRVTDEILAGIDAMFDLESATLDLEGAYADYEDQVMATAGVLFDATATTHEKEDASRDLRQEEIRLAGQALAVAQAFAREKGAADGSARSAELQAHKLAQLALKYPHLREEISGYVRKLGEIPGTKLTEVRSAIDSGSYWETKNALDRLAANRSSTIFIGHVNTGGGQFAVPLAEGALLTRPTYMLGGEAGDEVVLPLTNQSRMSALLSDPRVFGPVAAAMTGGGGSATSASGDVTNNVTNNIQNGDPMVIKRAVGDALDQALFLAGRS